MSHRYPPVRCSRPVGVMGFRIPLSDHMILGTVSNIRSHGAGPSLEVESLTICLVSYEYGLPPVSSVGVRNPISGPVNTFTA